jgi:hypothetical protein
MADDKIQQTLLDLSGRLGQLETTSGGYKNYATFNSDAIRDLSSQFNSIENKLAQLQEQITHGASSQGTSGDAAGSGTNSTPTGSGTYQVTTDTNFTLPTLYGRAQLRGAVFDAELSADNANLTTCIALSEITGFSPYSTDYTLHEVYFNDALLTLDANGIVTNATLNDGNTTTKYNENTSVRLYQGLSWIPISNIQPGVPSEYASATTFMEGWNGITHRASNMLFAQIEQKYDAANGVQGIGTWTFDISNDHLTTNPGDIVFDYLRANRYGANYELDSIDQNSFTGSGVNSLKSVSNQEFLFTTLEVADSNVSAIPTITTGGAIATMTAEPIFQSGNATTLTANLMSGGDLTANVDANNYNRFKLFWARGENNAVTDISMIGTNTLKGFLDIARPVPDGANASQIPGATDPTYGDPIYTSSNATPITAFLLKGDKIRPEGSRVVYTVAEDVDVPNPGYESFDIPLEERVIFLEVDPFSNTNANLNVVGSDPTVAWQYSPDFNLVAYNGEWPSDGANVSNMDAYSNVIFSNALVGASAFSSPSESLGGQTYLGTEPKAQINGLLDNTRSVRENINELMRHSFAELTYDNRTGKWRAVPDGNSEIGGAFLFNEENILSELTVATSDVSNFFNAARATYVEKTHNSVTEDVLVFTSEYDKNANESDHVMELNYPLTVSGSEATRKADEKLRQNRKDLSLEFVADYSAIVVDPGDLVKVTVDAYGFDEKLFKVLKNEHSMEGGILKCRLAMMEWDLGVFRARIPFRKPVLDDISFEPEIYDNRIDAGGIDPESYPANSIPGGSIDTSTIPDGSIDGGAIADGTLPGSALENETVDTDQLANASVTPIKLSVGIPSVQKRSMNVVYEKDWTTSDTINIIGSTAPDFQEIEFQIPETGLYTIELSFINAMGTAYMNHYGGSGHHHKLGTVGGSTQFGNVEVSTNPSVYEPVNNYSLAGFPGENLAGYANTGAYDIGGADVDMNVFDISNSNGAFPNGERGRKGVPLNSDSNYANVWYTQASPWIEVEVTVEYLTPTGSAPVGRDFNLKTAAGGSTINFPITLNMRSTTELVAYTEAKITDWRVTFYNTGQNIYDTVGAKIPDADGNIISGSTDFSRGAKKNIVINPTITLTSASGFTFNT